MQPRGPEVRRARMIMIVVVVIAIIAGLVYISLSSDKHNAVNEEPTTPTSQVNLKGSSQLAASSFYHEKTGG